MYSIDYQKTSPVAKLTSIHVLIWFAATHHWLFHQLEIKNAFFHDILDEEVYME